VGDCVGSRCNKAVVGLEIGCDTGRSEVSVGEVVRESSKVGVGDMVVSTMDGT